ncbi:DUF1742-domain-containing protein [Ascobolus immersus RN42]|uniref:DUF1742-domain-containing protein n=1 Tax=Ascobolus immersus RN42 TaxID=1160509 RepID=A0A3N4I508_ASCIM|nr:DUF1742-domain-containing protein [Ascobolus immersus RN42]
MATQAQPQGQVSKSTAPYPNLYHVRKVADTASKPCYICYKPTSVVLITPCQKDFFYACKTHLADYGFATPKISAEEAEKKRKEELEAKEREAIKKEFEERQKRKKEKEKENESDKDKDKEKDKKDKEKEKEKNKKEDEKEEKPKTPEATTPKVDEYRIYSLHKDIYKMRLTRTTKIAQEKRIQELLRKPDAFPEVPKGFN